MSLLERLNQDMKQAMKDKNKQKLSVIRMVKASLQNESIKLGRDINEEEELTVLAREMKQRKDSLHEFENAGREDLAEGIRAEIAIITDYMPKQLTDDEVNDLVLAAIQEVGATSKAQMGKVMGAVLPHIKGKADASLVSRLVQQHLSK
ncbi:hypothetical protein A374_10775 [Fictibacillus macauensis ZFHKF-1]|uniref:GatB/YqeY domain-containing protein n=1 Tax=Fictibacillus macauensis ZFHKF-1 TaxID=1196324 RepID=I8J0F0_9BACL|nr:GatB/YqeY domain-containing protein [Fictibacillus macauensis]EIT85221.1 hypothetical protein A374_10775 [Fictibacillus macauensis ZFHKF-1]